MVSTRNVGWRRVALASFAAASVGMGMVAQVAFAHATGSRAAERPADAVTSELLKSGRFVRIHGKRVWGVPLTLQVNNSGRMTARPDFCGGAGCSSTVQNYSSGLCMTSLGGGQGADVEQWACNPGSANQQWLYYAGDGGPELLNGGDNLCMDDYQGRVSDNNPQIMWPCNASWPENYTTGSSGYSGWYLLHLSFYYNYCASGLGLNYDGAPVQLFTCGLDNPNQSWGGADLPG